jgi:hypothetical protein
MDDRIRMTTIFAVETRGRETFARVVDKACEMLRSDPGVLCFEWFMNEAGTTCMGWEEYRGSGDLLRTHKELAGALTDALKVARIERHVILGQVTQEVREIMPPIVEYLEVRHGFRR